MRMYFVKPDYHVRIGQKRYMGGERLPDLTEKQFKRFSKIGAIFCVDGGEGEPMDSNDGVNQSGPEQTGPSVPPSEPDDEQEPDNTGDSEPEKNNGNEENGDPDETGEPVQLPSIDATAGIVGKEEKPVKKGAKGRKAGNA